LDAAGKNELLWQSGVNFNDIPTWQRRAIGVYWEVVTKTGYNPVAGVDVKANRRRITADRDLPRGPDYRRFAAALLDPVPDAKQRGTL
jgi:tRNA(His) guanylyltransferase